MDSKRSIAKRSLFVLPACLMLISCGKKVTSSSGDNEVTLIPELNRAVNLEMSFKGDTESKSKSYLFIEDAQVRIPDQIHVKSGSPLRFTVNIYFNTNHNPEQRDTVSEFFCSYKNVKVIGQDRYYQEFLGCFEDVDADGELENLDYKAGQQIFQERWRYIRVDLVDGFSYEESEIFTELEIDYR